LRDPLRVQSVAEQFDLFYVINSGGLDSGCAKFYYLASMKTETCLNCSKALHPEDQFCPACGQKAETHRLNFSHIIHDIIHYFTHADKSIFRLVWLLLKQPGTTVREYLQGMRKKYFPPVNFFLISVAIMAISVKVFKTFSMDFMHTYTRNGVTRISGGGTRFLNFVTTRINWIYIGFIPVFAFLFWIFYTRRKYNYIEHLAAGLYWNGLTLLFLALVISPLMFAFDSLSAYYVLSLIFLTTLTVYYAIAYYHLLEYHSIWKFLRSLVISIVVTLLVMVLFVVMLRTFYIINGI
jgi:hypothetical protein